MKFPLKKISEIKSASYSGGTPLTSKEEYYNPPTIPWLKTKEVNYKPIYVTESYISELGLKNSSAKIVPPDSIIMAMYGQGDTAGRVAINKIPLTTNQACFNLIVDPNEADYRYVYYALVLSYDALVILKNGGAQPNLNAYKINNFEIPCPPPELQRRIGKMLYDYDELIDINRRRINILVQMAMRTYKEWFVHFRFPGRESYKFYGGLPTGWEYKTLFDIKVALESGSRPKGGIDDSLTEGIVSVGAENVLGLGRYNFKNEKLVPYEFFQRLKRGIIKDKDILIYKDGAYIGRTSLFQDDFPHKIACINEHVFLLRSAQDWMQYYLFFTLHQKAYFNLMQSLNKNSSQPGLNQKDILQIKVLVPSENIIKKFDELVTPIMHQIFSLAKQNRLLENMRDYLLPQLINGQLEVTTNDEAL